MEEHRRQYRITMEKKKYHDTFFLKDFSVYALTPSMPSGQHGGQKSKKMMKKVLIENIVKLYLRVLASFAV